MHLSHLIIGLLDSVNCVTSSNHSIILYVWLEFLSILVRYGTSRA